MEFFESYLKKLNHNGDNFQERIITRREKKFDAFLKRSTYKSDEIKDENGIVYTGVIHPTKDSEKTCIYNLLAYKKDVFTPGTLLYNKGNTWLITHKTLDGTKGYNLYSLMLLPTILTIENSEDRVSFPARITNDATSMIDDYFSTISGTNRQYRELDRDIKVICKYYDFFKKDQKMVIMGDTYKIEGINKTAVPGCIYLTLGQCLTDASKFESDSDNTNDSFWGET